MSYTYNRHLPNTAIDDADMRLREALKEKGFGVLTEIDVQATMKKKIDRDVDGYRMVLSQTFWFRFCVMADMPLRKKSGQAEWRQASAEPG